MNYRFWIYVNGGPVKLTLKPNQTLCWSQVQRTEEGWASEYCQWHNNHEACEVEREWHTRQRDCDGLGENSGVDTSRAHELHSVEPYDDTGYMFPQWHERSYDQRDHTAEAMGY